MKNKYGFLGKKKRHINKVLLKSVPLIILFIIAFVLLCPTLTRGRTTRTVSSQLDQIQSRLQSQLQGLDFGNHTMYVGIWVLHIYSFQYTTGTYTLDMYVYFFWTDPDITTANWYLTNGYPINSEAKVLINRNINGTIKYEFYRVTATLNTPPDARDYPFDQINLKISLELTNAAVNSINLVWLQNQTGLDPAFINPNWNTTNIELSTVKHSYPLGIEAPYAEMTITQAKTKPSSALASLISTLGFFICVCSIFLVQPQRSRVGWSTNGFEYLDVNHNNIIPTKHKWLHTTVLIFVDIWLVFDLGFGVFVSESYCDDCGFCTFCQVQK